MHCLVRGLPIALLALAFAPPAPAANAGPRAQAATADATAPPALAHQPLPRVFSGGQPAPGEWKAIAARGVTTVIDLRPDAERPGRDEATEVRAAGMRYRQIAVAGAQGLDADKARLLWQAIEDAPGKVLVHCASGNRAGGLLALAAAQEGGMTSAQALALGRAAGLGHAEPRVRALLGLPAAPAEDAAP